MSIKVRFDLNISEVPAEVAPAAGLVDYDIDAGYGETGWQIPGSHDLGPSVLSSLVSPGDPGTVLAATGGDESANVSEGVSAYLFASSDGSLDPARLAVASLDVPVNEHSMGSGGVIGQDVNGGYPSTGLHIAPPIDRSFVATSAALFALTPPVPAIATLASLTPALFGIHGAEAGIGPGGAAGAVVPQQISHAGSDATALAGSAAVPMSLENSETGSPIANAGVGSGGATAAQVRQALDESGSSGTGAGIKVGVLSDSFNDLGGAVADEANGALPSASNIQVISDLASGGTDEGRAMMQIIHDIAPGASLAFYTAFNSEQDFANGILALAAAGSKVIVDDVSYSDEPFFQNGVVAQAIQTVEAEGVTYVTAAGNDGSNGYQAAWTPISGSFDGTFFTDAESFGGSGIQTVTINTEGTGATVPLVLEWDQPYGAATADLQVLVFHNGTLIGQYSNRNSGQELNNPLVMVPFSASGTYQIAIENLSGPNPGLIKEITEGDGLPATISGANAGTVVGHAMTPGAISAGAVSVAATPAFGFNPAINESFSSSGAGSELLFANNGTRLSSPDVLSPVTVSGLDDIATTVIGNLGDFYGTSAASASLAGVAALILSANPTLTPAQVELIMEESALPMANSAVSGAGLVQVDPAVADALNFNLNLRLIGAGDFKAGGNANLAWQDGSGVVLWLGSGTGLTESVVPGASMGAAWTADGVGDFNGDGNADLLWTNASGQAAIWEMNGSSLAGFGVSAGQMGTAWQVAGIGDFNADGHSDILWTNSSGQAAVWTMNGTALAGFAVSNGAMGSAWHVVAVGDFNADGHSDVLWESTSGAFATWEMNGANLSGFFANVGQVGPGWEVAGVGHFSGAADSTSDIVVVNSLTNQVQIWQMANGVIADVINPSGLYGMEWHLAAVGNFAGDANSDLLWISTSGAASLWEIQGSSVHAVSLSAPMGPNLQLSSSVTVSSVQLNDAAGQQADLLGGAVTFTGTIAAGATLELTAASSEAISFGGSTGTLILDHSATFSGEIFNLAGNGNLSSSDQIDLKDIAFGPDTVSAFIGNSTGGTLTITDAQGHVANILLAGNYTDSTFSLSSDGNGGTIAIDPPAANAASGTLSFNETDSVSTPTASVSPHNGGAGYLGSFTVDAVDTASGQETIGWHFNFDSGPAVQTITQSYDVTVAAHQANGTNSTVSQTIAVTIGGSGPDTFVFKPGFGTDVIANAKGSDTIELDGFASVANAGQLQTLLTEAQAGVSQSLFQAVNGGHDTMINLGNHDSIMLANVKIADLHASNFIIHA